VRIGLGRISGLAKGDGRGEADLNEGGAVIRKARQSIWGIEKVEPISVAEGFRAGRA
jgi:hypothetical protein